MECTSPPMVAIYERLWLGTLLHARQLANGNPHGIRALINCTEESVDNPKLAQLMLGMRAGTSISRERLNTALSCIRACLCVGPVLVCCHSANSRPAALIVAHLYSGGMSWDEADRFIAGMHPETAIHPVIALSLRQAFGSAVPNPHDLGGGFDVQAQGDRPEQPGTTGLDCGGKPPSYSLS